MGKHKYNTRRNTKKIKSDNHADDDDNDAVIEETLTEETLTEETLTEETFIVNDTKQVSSYSIFYNLGNKLIESFFENKRMYDYDTHEQHEEDYNSNSTKFNHKFEALLSKLKYSNKELYNYLNENDLTENENHNIIYKFLLNENIPNDIKIRVYNLCKDYMTKKIDDSSDFIKIKQYINYIQDIPFNKYIYHNTNLFQTVINAKKYFDEYIHGLNDVKENIIHYLIKSLSSNNNTSGLKGNVLGLQGPPGVGKCLGYNTPILLFNGSIKMVQDITKSDILIGPDSNPRFIISTTTGKELMYKIIDSETNEYYCVNKSHILSLVHSKDLNKVININIEEYFNNLNKYSEYKGYRTGVIFCGDSNKDCIKFSSVSDRLNYLKNIIHKKGYVSHFIPNNTFIYTNDIQEIKDVEFIARSLSIKTKVSIIEKNNLYEIKLYNFNYNTFNIHDVGKKIVYDIQVEVQQEGNYFGFEITGDRLFLLGDFTVTHNTRLANGLSKILNLPLYQINLGGMRESHYLTGHGFTYIGSKPGKIYNALVTSKCMNPIIFLDECDKIEENSNINGVLIHLLDEEQNHKFQDEYLDNITLDMSKVFFILSFNDIEKIDPILRNRMKVINIDKPSINDKINIVKQCIMPEYIKHLFISKYEININDLVIRYIIESKTEKESGLRFIKKNIENILDNLNSSILLIENSTNINLNNIFKDFKCIEIVKYLNTYNLINYTNTHKKITIDIQLVDLILKNNINEYNESYKMMYC